jgi:hypothetical protein
MQMRAPFHTQPLNEDEKRELAVMLVSDYGNISPLITTVTVEGKSLLASELHNTCRRLAARGLLKELKNGYFEQTLLGEQAIINRSAVGRLWEKSQ